MNVLLLHQYYSGRFSVLTPACINANATRNRYTILSTVSSSENFTSLFGDPHDVALHLSLDAVQLIKT